MIIKQQKYLWWVLVKIVREYRVVVDCGGRFDHFGGSNSSGTFQIQYKYLSHYRHVLVNSLDWNRAIGHDSWYYDLVRERVSCYGMNPALVLV